MLGRANPMLPMICGIERVKRETHDTFTFELTPPCDYSFAPGQFNMLYVFGVGEVAISVSGDPSKKEALVHTIRAVGSVTKAICKLKGGGSVGVRGAFGSDWQIDKAVGKDVVLVAGGIGLAPLRPVIYHILANRAEFGRVSVLYGTRTTGDLVFRREIEQWRGRFDLDFEVTVDTASADWRGDVGFVTTLIRKASFDPLETVAMLCGPEIMMRFSIAELKKLGLTSEQIFVSMERNMKCAVGFCGHCQFGPAFVCRDGPVFRLDHLEPLFGKHEI